MLTVLALATAPAHAGFAPTYSENFDTYETNSFHGTNGWVTEFPPAVGGDGWTTLGISGVRTTSTTTSPPLGTWGGTGDPVDNILHRGLVTTGDVRLDVKVDYANDLLGYGNAMGVVWRYAPAASTYYLVALSRTNGAQGRSFNGGAGPVSEALFTGVKLFRVTSTTTNVLAQSATSLTAGTQQALRVEMIGGRITVQLDVSRNGVFEGTETLINVLDASPLPAGEVGLFSYGGGNEQATFDDLVVSQNDADGDLVADISDNCVATRNPTQADFDNNGKGDACDDPDADGAFDEKELIDGTNRLIADTDGDTLKDGVDNCGLVSNLNQADLDSDGKGDVCDPDDDGDTVSDTSDNCPFVANKSQSDIDFDSLGDACDDDDDGDGFVDGADNCPMNANPTQFDSNSNGKGDACDDIDGDSVFDALDNCPFASNVSQRDTDADGVGDACDADPDGDGYGSGVDCDETRADVNPGAIEVCDGRDQNCDNDVDNGLLGCNDFDRDGAPNAIDCDDTDPNVRPGAPEQCNGRDDDCDSFDDNGVVSVPWYRDLDGDGHGENGVAVTTNCKAPAGTVWRNDDCVDNDAVIYPGADETCDGRDNDCDAVIDTDAVDGPWYNDLDHDGYGVSFASVCSPNGGATYTQVSGDCNDNNPAIVPGHIDLCDGVDEDCDGTDDEDALTSTYYVDSDGDSWGWANDATQACSRPAGYAGQFGDCDDDLASVNPDALEIPGDGIDQDCDGIDPGDPDSDSDGDGLSDGLEDALGLDPTLADSDGDGVDDAAELGLMTNPTDSDGDGWIDADDADDDNDGVLSSEESSDDTDGDGIPDRLDTDSDGDGVVDGAEQGDADGDGLIDALDVGHGDHPTPEPLEDLGFGCVSARGPGALGAVLALMFARRRRRASVRP